MAAFRRSVYAFLISGMSIALLAPTARADTPSDKSQALMRKANRAQDASDFKRAELLATQALQLDPSLVDAHRILGYIAYGKALVSAATDPSRPWLFTECARHYHRAYELAPDDAYKHSDVQSAMTCAGEGGDAANALRFADEIIADANRAQLSPREYDVYYYFAAQRGRAAALEALGRTDEALAAREETVRIGHKRQLWERQQIDELNALRAKLALPPTTIEEVIASANVVVPTATVATRAATATVSPSAAVTATTAAAPSPTPDDKAEPPCVAELVAKMRQVNAEAGATAAEFSAAAKKSTPDNRCAVTRATAVRLATTRQAALQLVERASSCGTAEVSSSLHTMLTNWARALPRPESVDAVLENCPLVAPMWTVLGEGQGKTFSADFAQVRKLGNDRAMWSRIAYVAPREDGVRTIQTRSRIDCASRRLSATRIVVFADAAETRMLDSFDPPLEWQVPQSGQPGFQMITRACAQ